MSKWVKNNTLITKTYAGKDVLAGTYREVDSDLWTKDAALLTDIGNSDALMAKDDSGTTDITDINQAIDFLKSNVPSEVEVVKQDQIPPFAAKTLPITGQKLFRRKHGVSETVTAGQSKDIKLIVPYNLVKINKAEIINGKAGDTVDLKILDTPQGHIQLSMGTPPESVIPSLMLNQFGFDVNVPDGFYVDESNYDADMIKDMEIVITYKNNDISDRTVGINITLHEVI